MTARRSGTPGTPGSTGSDMAAQFKAMGVPHEQLQAWMAQADPAGQDDGDTVALAPHLWPALELGLCLRTQMRAVSLPTGHVRHLGLDYAALPAVKRDLGLPLRGPAARALLMQLRTVESEMVDVLNEREGQA